MWGVTTIDELAHEIRRRHSIGRHAAAVDVARVHVDQIADDPDLWNADTEHLTDAGRQLVLEAVAASYSVGAIATRAAQILTDLEDQAVQIRDTRDRLAELLDERNGLIRAALRTEAPVPTIAAAAGVKPSRVHQINTAMTR